MSNLRTDRRLRFFPVATAQFSVPAGAAGWVDTNVSATTGTATDKLWVVVCETSGGSGITGVRAHGEAIDNKLLSNFRMYTQFSYVDVAGHVDLYRDGALGNFYTFVGYLQ